MIGTIPPTDFERCFREDVAACGDANASGDQLHYAPDTGSNRERFGLILPA